MTDNGLRLLITSIAFLSASAACSANVYSGKYSWAVWWGFTALGYLAIGAVLFQKVLK